MVPHLNSEVQVPDCTVHALVYLVLHSYVQSQYSGPTDPSDIYCSSVLAASSGTYLDRIVPVLR